MEVEDFEPLFGEPKVEWSATTSTPVRQFLFQVHAPDSSHLTFHATDFFSSTFAAVRSIEQLDDMRDDIGIGGSWSEFLEYLVNSIKFGDVKLVLEGKSKSDGPESARLIAQKSKGMPRISISMLKCVDTAANETMAMLSLDLYKAHQKNQKLLLQEQEGRCQLTKKLSAEQEKSKHFQKQLDGLHYPKRHKSHDQLTSDTLSATNPSDVSDVQIDQNPSPMKASKRVVPAHRRSKVRGALLRDTDEDD
ncbi:unnamed protein product [Lactuca virosa]|uniref:Uncharacterized protein n=1 Tax=Lactuca virosa TaxID=75947 RepID=A0AAU9MGW8_9ASTR|nr:unnamed protein product [Lactuca virosa]